MFDVPVALISLIDEDRQWFKSNIGWPWSSTPRDVSFCGTAITGPEIFIVNDATQDERFHDNPLVTDGTVRFYAGRPLAMSDGCKIGTLCIIDTEPRDLNKHDQILMDDLGRMVEDELEAQRLATSCSLTGLSNRRGFLASSTIALIQSERFETTVRLAYFDMDSFKSINDSFGHAEGDKALCDFTAMLSTTFRKSDIIGRIGGDEFAVLMTNCREGQCKIAVDRLRELIANHNSNNQLGYAIDFSVGLDTYQLGKHASIEDLLASADKAMFENKRMRHDSLPK